MKELIFGFLFIGGIVAVVLAQVTGIGMFLCEWGVNGVGVGVAAWSGFSLWLKLLVGGLISIVIGRIGLD
jgi:hypothetical protein